MAGDRRTPTCYVSVTPSTHRLMSYKISARVSLIPRTIAHPPVQLQLSIAARRRQSARAYAPQSWTLTGAY